MHQGAGRDILETGSSAITSPSLGAFTLATTRLSYLDLDGFAVGR